MSRFDNPRRACRRGNATLGPGDAAGQSQGLLDDELDQRLGIVDDPGLGLPTKLRLVVTRQRLQRGGRVVGRGTVLKLRRRLDRHVHDLDLDLELAVQVGPRGTFLQSVEVLAVHVVRVIERILGQGLALHVALLHLKLDRYLEFERTRLK